jgi:acyl-ACP thioesterase
VHGSSADPAPDAPELVPRPPSGRVVETTRRVRLGDVRVDGRLRIDGLGRYLQDVARDDSAGSGIENPMGWVVRRTYLEVSRSPVFQEGVQLRTWCSGYGSRWAERRTTVTGERGGCAETATLWVHVDPVSGRPARLGEDFFRLYGEAAQGRAVDARLPPESPVPDGAVRLPWQWRRADLDVLGHVNNAAYGAALEEALADAGMASDAYRVWIEYRDPALPGAAGELCYAAGADPRADGLRVWVRAGDRTACTARILPEGDGQVREEIGATR